MTYNIGSPDDIDYYREKIEGFVNKAKQLSSSYKESVTSYLDCYESAILSQQMVGGLSPYALCIEGMSPAYDKAEEVKSKIDGFRSSLTSVSSRVSSIASKQSGIEINKLKVAINRKIGEERANYQNELDLQKKNQTNIEYIQRGESAPYPYITLGVNGSLSQISERIKSYGDKLRALPEQF